MIGARLVTIAMLYSTSSLQRAVFAVMPRTHFSVNARTALLRIAHVFQEMMRQDGHHHVQFEAAARRRRPGDRRVAAEHLRAHLHQRLAHHRVDLARHDRTARLRGRQRDLAEAAARAAAQPADVVGDLEKADGNRLELAAGLDDAVLGRLRLEMVRRLAERRRRVRLLRCAMAMRGKSGWQFSPVPTAVPPERQVPPPRATRPRCARLPLWICLA